MQAVMVYVFAALAVAAPLAKRGTNAPNGDKKGLAYTDGNVTDILAQNGSASWAYNWGAARNAPKFQQIPMYWGPGAEGDKKGIITAIEAGAPWLLTYNEPDQTTANGGCAATPDEAYLNWNDDMAEFRSNKNIQIVCPAVTSVNMTTGPTGGPSGLTWLSDFISMADDPAWFGCNAQALHWLGTLGQSGKQQAQSFISYIESARITVNEIYRKQDVNLWITEFSPLPLDDVQTMSDFLAVAIPWLDAQGYISRYSPYKADYLVNDDVLNEAGKTFVSVE